MVHPRWRRILLVAVSATMMVFGLAGATGRATAQQQTFTDVSPSTQFYAQIEWLAGQGVTTGYPDGSYRPLQAVTRDAMAAFLYRLAGSPAYTPPAPQSPFTDINPSTQFYKEMCWLHSTGIATGYPDGSYRPLQAVNRDAMAAFLYRFDKSPVHMAPQKSPFTDITPSTQFYKEMSWLKDVGISTGYPGGGYQPLAPVNRDAMAAFMDRLHTLRAGGITDSNLLNCVDRTLGLANGTQPTGSQAAASTSLSCPNDNITSIQGLQAFTGLSTLALPINHVSDLTPLAGLTGLTGLNVADNQVSDITPLAGLTNLSILSLGGLGVQSSASQGNEISDLTPLENLSGLTELWLNDNHVSDITPLAVLTDLRLLDLQDNQISNIRPLADLINLGLLELRDNQISDVTPLTGLTSLTVLDLGDNQISDIAPLAGLTNLTALVLGGNPICTASPDTMGCSS